jgi:hypothetical protein
MGILKGGKVVVGGLLDEGRGGWWAGAKMVDGGGVVVPLSNCWKATGTKGTELVHAIVHRIAAIVTCSQCMMLVSIE